MRNLISLDDVEVVPASSRSEESLSAARQIAGDKLQTFTDWHDALAVDGLDAVVIALTNDQHHAAALAAFDKDLHVLCEKPLGLILTDMKIADAPEDANFIDGSGRVDRGIRPQLVDFVASCREGKQPMNGGQSAKMSVAIYLAAQQSIKRGEVVDIGDMLGE